jgi:hypothetical protein
MCDALQDESRRDCYASVGVDVDRVDEYLGKALCLEAALRGELPGFTLGNTSLLFVASHHQQTYMTSQ